MTFQIATESWVNLCFTQFPLCVRVRGHPTAIWCPTLSYVFAIQSTAAPSPALPLNAALSELISFLCWSVCRQSENSTKGGDGGKNAGRHECRQTSPAMASKMASVQTWRDGKLPTLAQQAELHCSRDPDGVGGLLPRFTDLKWNWPRAEPRHPSYRCQPSMQASHIHQHFPQFILHKETIDKRTWQTTCVINCGEPHVTDSIFVELTVSDTKNYFRVLLGS